MNSAEHPQWVVDKNAPLVFQRTKTLIGFGSMRLDCGWRPWFDPVVGHPSPLARIGLLGSLGKLKAELYW